MFAEWTPTILIGLIGLVVLLVLSSVALVLTVRRGNDLAVVLSFDAVATSILGIGLYFISPEKINVIDVLIVCGIPLVFSIVGLALRKRHAAARYRSMNFAG